MKILFLHLSDMHFEKQADIDFYHSKKISDSLNVIGDFDHVLIIISGDIANDGFDYQYKFAWKWLGDLIIKIKDTYRVKTDVCVVPGNHDVDLTLGDLGHATIQELYRTNKMESELTSEFKKLEHFYNYAKGNHCEYRDPFFAQKIIKLDKFAIEVNLINSAPFTTHDEEKGLHYLPQTIIQRLAEPTGADFVVTVMHHSYHWFNDSLKSQLEHVLLSKSSLIFFGHEHILDAQNINDCSGNSACIFAGGILCKKGDWTKSEYFASVLENPNLILKQFGLKWIADERFYHHSLIQRIPLPLKPSSEKKLIPDANFLSSFFEDKNHKISKDFSDYFVFPRLFKEELNERNLTDDITNEKDFLTDLDRKKKIVIAGSENSGKSALLKQLFKILSKSKIVLFCDTENISGSCKRLIKNTFEDIYGPNEADFLRFEQTPKTEKVLIIDDVHRIKVKNFNALIEELEESFENIIYSTNTIMEFDMLERLKKIIKEDGSYYRYRILPFYSDKMKELITKIVKIKSPYEDVDNIGIVLSTALRKQRSLFNLSPEFIIQYTEYFYNHIQDISQNDGELFGKVFEANIANSVKPYVRRSKISVDKVFILLDKIAYFIHTNKAYPIKQTDLINVIQQYNNRYGGDIINIDEFIGIVLNAKIIYKCGNENKYKFGNKNHLAYFIAREIRRKYLNDHDDSDLYKILEFSCFGINADILLFLTYITDNLNMLRDILGASKILTDDWIEFDLNKGNVPYLTNIKPLEVMLPTAESIKNEKDSELEQEKLRDNNHFDTIDIYDYKEQEIDELFNQLNRAVSLFSIISRCLPNFEHMMEKEDKDMFVDSIYRLPFKIFYLWANEVEKNKEELIKLLKELPENDYFHEKVPTDEEVLRLLQWDSITMLLDLMNLGVIYSIKEHTEIYFNSFDFKKCVIYYLMHLKVLAERGRIKDFFDDAKDIFDSEKCIMTKTMVKRIVRHLLTHSSTISLEDVQRIESKFFSDVDDHKLLLAERMKNIK